MKILITGGKGQLASSLSFLCPKNIKMYAFDKKELDITNVINLTKIIYEIHPRIIINTAAFTKVDLAERQYQEAYNINSNGPRNLSKLVRDLDIFLIHISTDCVFDGNKVDAYTELDITNPISVYGKTKLLGEKEIITKLEKYIIFRVSWLYGPRGNNFVFKIIENIKKKNKLRVVNDQFGRPTSTLDFSTFIWKVVQRILNKDFKSGIYNYSDGGQIVSRYDVAKYIVRKLNSFKFSENEVEAVLSSEMNMHAKRPRNSSLCLDKTLREFNLKETNWKDSILKVIRSFEDAY